MRVAKDLDFVTEDEPEFLPPSKRSRCPVKWTTVKRCANAGYWGVPGNHHCRWDSLPEHSEHRCPCGAKHTEDINVH